MSHTPTQTPTAKKANKKLPMIVDIALDDNGKQLYQVHESSRFVRKEMPKSTKFNNNVSGTLIDDEYEEKTPIRKILGTISPSTLNQKKSADEESTEDSNLTEPDSGTRHNSFGLNMNMHNDLSFYNDNSLHLSAFDYDHNEEAHERDHPQDNYDHRLGNGSSEENLGADLSLSKANDIWPDDVEQAFEEVLSIIPKNGLNKIKISGRSCGRNELISDYILTKTGKFRTRKQVSSHIQVIKNLGQKDHIIKLINEGPSFESEEAQAQNTKRFEEIFSKITLNKSLGINKSNKRPFSDVSDLPVKKEKKSKSLDSGTSMKSRPLPLDLSIGQVNLNLSFENFYISIQDSMLSGNPMLLTVQDNQEMKNLKLKPNANISNRFPDLTNLASLNLPILHNFVKLHLPHRLPLHYSIPEGLKTSLYLKASNTNSPYYLNKDYSIFTIIYSYGKEFFKINESHIKLNDNYSFLNKFWKFFINNEISSASPNLNHLTIKQILYESPADAAATVPEDAKDKDSAANYLKIPKSKIRGVFLWEFIKVDDAKDALTTTSTLTLSEDPVPVAFPPTSANVPQTLQQQIQLQQFQQQLHHQHQQQQQHHQQLDSHSHQQSVGPQASFHNGNGQHIVPQVVNYPSVTSNYYDPPLGSSTGTATDLMSSNYAYSSIHPTDSSKSSLTQPSQLQHLQPPSGTLSGIATITTTATSAPRTSPSTATTAAPSATAGDTVKVEPEDLNQLNPLEMNQLNLPINEMSGSTNSPMASQLHHMTGSGIPMTGQVPMSLQMAPQQMTANAANYAQSMPQVNMVPHQNMDYDYFYYSDANYQA